MTNDYYKRLDENEKNYLKEVKKRMAISQPPPPTEEKEKPTNRKVGRKRRAKKTDQVSPSMKRAIETTRLPFSRAAHYGGQEIKKASRGIESWLKHRKDPVRKEIKPVQPIYYWVLGRDGVTYKLEGSFKDYITADKEAYKKYQTYTVFPLHTNNQKDAVNEMIKMGLTDESEVSKYILTNGK